MKRLLSVLSAISGAILGAIFFIVLTALSVELIFDGKELAIVLSILVAVPLALLIGSGIGIWLGLHIQKILQNETNRKRQQVIKSAIVAGVVLLFPGAIAGMCWGFVTHSDPPSDRVLIDNFHRHETTFDQLASMMQSDKKSGLLVENGTYPEDPKTLHTSPQRSKEYQRLLKTINISHGFEAFDDGRIEFYSYARGSAATSDRIKGYAFLTKSPNNLSKQLGNSHTEDLIYRHIQGNWYLFYQYIPASYFEKD